MPAFLVPVEPGLVVIPLEKAIVLIGRESDCDVSLTQSRKVSRKHCCLAQVNNKIMARDLGSTNGIFLNGTRIVRANLPEGWEHDKVFGELPQGATDSRWNLLAGLITLLLAIGLYLSARRTPVALRRV